MPLQTDYVGTLFDNESNGGKVTVALTMGNKVLEKGYSASIILMIEAVHLSQSERFNLIDIGAPFKPAKDLLESFLTKGGKIFVCKSCMEHSDLSEATMDTRFSVVTADDVIDLTMAAKGTLQIA